MKKSHFLLAILLIFVSCNQSSEERQAMLPKSSGNINHLQVVINDDLWKGEVGETIRRIFATPVDGLPQEEPLYSISQLPLSSFDGFTQKHRIFLYVKKGDEVLFKTATDHYAKPQKGFFISAPTIDKILELIEENKEKILENFLDTEIKEKQRRISLSLLEVKSAEDSLKVKINIPSAYRLAKITNNFVWMRKDIRSGDLNVLIYEMPLTSFNNEDTRIQEIIKMRDSIGKTHIPGPNEGSYMITEEAFSPYLFESEIDGRFAYEVKGTWEVYNFFMAGPFLTYIVEDIANNRLLILEGFTFAPSIDKRDYQFELEAILKSVRIIK